MTIGPQTLEAQVLHETKYRASGETYDDYCVRYARKVTENDSTNRHFRHLLDGLREQRILPAGRQQQAVGHPYKTTAFNCFVGGTLEDSMEGIYDELKLSAMTLRTGGGCGWDFSPLRPYGDPIRGLGEGAYATGPVSFMEAWDGMCKTVMSAGHRRGAMMATLRVDHPDIMRFINAKQDENTLKRFNISVWITDKFMEAFATDGSYNLKYAGRVYNSVRAADVWARIMERNWDWSEPGILFGDRINQMNPLGYCEQIAATNPCGEQPLPPHGACLLGSVNIVKYLVPSRQLRVIAGGTPARPMSGNTSGSFELDLALMKADIEVMVRAFDRVIDITQYPLRVQRREAQRKRRMGIGPTGMANALEIMGYPYGSPEYLVQQGIILEFIRDAAYQSSIKLATERGRFPAFDAKGWLSSGFAKTLPKDTQSDIRKYGLRNGLLLSIAPTGTISQCADNVSSGVEPPFDLEYDRLIEFPDGPKKTVMKDWAFREHRVKGLTAQDVSPYDHIAVLCNAQQFVDSSISKTCNVNGARGEDEAAPASNQITFTQFKELYMQAWEGGAKGCTTHNSNGKRSGILTAHTDARPEQSTKPLADADACLIDPITGTRTCDS